MRSTIVMETVRCVACNTVFECNPSDSTDLCECPSCARNKPVTLFDEVSAKEIKLQVAKAKLDKTIERARKQEQNDNHLDDEKRDKIVARFRKLYPEVKLDNDMTEAYCQILFD